MVLLQSSASFLLRPASASATVFVVSILGILFLAGIRVLFNVWNDELRSVPGPILARFSRIWLLYQYWRGDYEKTNIQLHAKYGPIVRIAPGQYSIDDPDANRAIYGHSSQYTKTAWYKPFGHPDFPNLFNDLDAKAHSQARRRQADKYAMSALVSYEPYVEECIHLFRQRLDDAASSSEIVDMHRYNQCYALELIGLITYSRHLGFLDRCQDEIGLIKSLHIDNQWKALIGVYPNLVQLCRTVWNKFNKFPDVQQDILDYVRDYVDQQISLIKADSNFLPMDFVQKMIKTQKANPSKTLTSDILSAAGTNTSAGSDTTGIALSSVLYHLYRHPTTLAALRTELDDAVANGTMAEIPTLQQSLSLPYLQAVIKEAMRLHPAVGYTLPRVVPQHGAVLAGYHFPAGSIVGVNAWVTHRNVSLWGEDAAMFRPERFLEGKVPPEIHHLWFGQGSRTCIGKNISLLELSKLIPDIVRRYDIDPILPKGESWRCENRFLIKPMNFMCRIRQRSNMSVETSA